MKPKINFSLKDFPIWIVLRVQGGANSVTEIARTRGRARSFLMFVGDAETFQPASVSDSSA